MSTTPEDQNENTGQIKLSLVLTKRGRSAKGKEEITAILARHNLHETGRGFATMSLTAPPESLKELGVEIAPAASPPAADWVGAGSASPEPDVTIPEELRPFVAAISISLQARHFRDEK